MAKRKSTSVEYTAMTPADLRRVASQFHAFARRYESIAAEVEKLGVNATIKVKGLATLNHAIKRINGSLASADSALIAAQLRFWEQAEAADDVAELEERIKKGRKPPKKDDTER